MSKFKFRNIFNTKCKPGDSSQNILKYEDDEGKKQELNFQLKLHQGKAQQLRDAMSLDAKI